MSLIVYSVIIKSQIQIILNLSLDIDHKSKCLDVKTMEVEEILSASDSCLSKVTKKFAETGVIDYSSLDKFLNLIECLPEIDDVLEIEDELISQAEDILFNKMWRTRKLVEKKLSTIVELFDILKCEHENECNEHVNSTKENIFLGVCAFAYTMLMFAP